MCSNSDDDCVENTSSLKLSKDYGTPKFQSPFAPEESLVRALWPLLGAAIARSGHSHEDIDQTFGCLARWPFALEPTDFVTLIIEFLDENPFPFEPYRMAFELNHVRDW